MKQQTFNISISQKDPTQELTQEEKDLIALIADVMSNPQLYLPIKNGEQKEAVKALYVAFNKELAKLGTEHGVSDAIINDIKQRLTSLAPAADPNLVSIKDLTDIKAKIDDINNRLSLKVQINNQQFDKTHSYKIFVKDNSDSHTYTIVPVLTEAEKQAILDQITKLGNEIKSLNGSLPQSVLDEIRKNTADIASLVHSAMNLQDYMRISPNEANGNYKLVVRQADGTFHTTDDFDYNVLQTIQNREIDNGDLITWLMNRPVKLGVITGTHAADLSQAPTERFSKHPLIEGDVISLKYPRGVSEPNKHYIQDFVWLDGIWQPKHI